MVAMRAIFTVLPYENAEALKYEPKLVFVD
jgi:hypothetical protein